MPSIAFLGFAGSGKDTAAQLFVEHGFHPLSFGDTLKDMLAAVFGWPRRLLEGDTEASRRFRETVDPWWAARLDIAAFSPRWAMRHLGTDVLRQHFHPQLWILATARRADALGPAANIVFRDCRFPEEVAFVRARGAVVVRIRRGADPPWMHDATMANLGSSYHVARMRDEHGAHVSEWAWIGLPVDHVVSNDTSPAALHAELRARLPALASVLAAPA